MVNNLVCALIKKQGMKTVCHKHFRSNHHRHTGQYTSKECECCMEIERECGAEDVGL